MLANLQHIDVGTIQSPFCRRYFQFHSLARKLLNFYSNVTEIGSTVASFTKEVNSRLAKRALKTNGRLANLELTSLVKEATVSGPVDKKPVLL